MPLTIIRNDITKMHVDAIVNAANTRLQAGGGVCGAIFHAAGAGKLQKACDKLAPIKTGGAVITKGYALPAKYVIHTAGPVYSDGKHDAETLLRSCYKNALDLAKKHYCTSIAFPLISSGIYGYPKDEALRVATSEISKWLSENDMEVSLVVFDIEDFALPSELFVDVKTFVDDNYVGEHSRRYERRIGHGSYHFAYVPTRRQIEDEKRTKALIESAFSDCSATEEANESLYEQVGATPPADNELQASPIAASLAPRAEAAPKKLEDVVGRLDEPFSATLLRLIESKGKSDVEVYKRANLDRKLFSKIRKGKGYMPSKKTAVALAIALELSLQETRDLLERAGFALSRSVVFDVIIEYFVTNGRYDVYEINNVLFEYDQPLLGG